MGNFFLFPIPPLHFPPAAEPVSVRELSPRPLALESWGGAVASHIALGPQPDLPVCSESRIIVGCSCKHGLQDLNLWFTLMHPLRYFLFPSCLGVVTGVRVCAVKGSHQNKCLWYSCM